MSIELIVHPGVDSAFIAWRTPFIAGCRGFALRRRIKRAAGSAPSPNTVAVAAGDGLAEEVVASWVGFADGPAVPEGTRKPTTEWPIQKYLWSDFMVNPGDAVAYAVQPMLGSAGALTPGDASGWSAVVTIGAETSDHTNCYFNRGIVASQWLARQLPAVKPGTALMKSIKTPGNRIRDFLGGPIRDKLVDLLRTTNAAGGHVYAVLFELSDPELLPLLAAFGVRAHVVLGNGSVKAKGDDENADARQALTACDLHDRMSAPRALAHNKFLVLCDAAATPEAVWTGSTNWTETGLCTQANNAVLVRDPALAGFYRAQWDRLVAAGNASPKSLLDADAKPHVPAGGGTTLWFTPMKGGLDLAQAGALIAGARDGILFMMFNPGPRGSLLNDIISLASPDSPAFRPDLYIQGVVNQNPGTLKNPVTLFNRGDRIDANADVVLPAAIKGTGLKFWRDELLKAPRAHAMVHSKVVVIDPYGANPVVMTGSHNMGPKASGTNDENLLIIRGNGDLASQYAGKIMEIYNQYRWRASVTKADGKPEWKGLADGDAWQIKDAAKPYDKRRLRELAFWFGGDAPLAARARRKSAAVPRRKKDVAPA